MLPEKLIDGRMIWLRVSKVHILGFLLLALKLARCGLICSKNEYLIIDPQGKKSCLTCNDCPVGSGLAPPCGTKLYTPFHIDCFVCVSGSTYSDEHGPGSCKTCGLCAPNEIVNTTCKPGANTVCSQTCVGKFYYDTNTHDCQPCSECCSNEGSRIEECKRHGMPLTKQCSVHQHCRRSTSTAQPSGATPLSGGTRPTIHDSLGNQHALIAGLFLIFSVITIVIIILIRRGSIGVPWRRNYVGAEEARDRCYTGMSGYKLLQDLDHEIRDKLEDILAPDRANGVGNWYDLGLEYGMDKNKLDQLVSNRDCKKAAEAVLNFINATKPGLSVFDFCKTMEKIKQKKIVGILKDHMFTQDEQTERYTG